MSDAKAKCTHAFRLVDFDGLFVLRDIGTPSAVVRAECVTCGDGYSVVVPKDNIRTVSDQLAEFAP